MNPSKWEKVDKRYTTAIWPFLSACQVLHTPTWQELCTEEVNSIVAIQQVLITAALMPDSARFSLRGSSCLSSCLLATVTTDPRNAMSI